VKKPRSRKLDAIARADTLTALKSIFTKSHDAQFDLSVPAQQLPLHQRWLQAMILATFITAHKLPGSH
jgi:hypothetical protein